jgi:hypothetical protein
MWSSGVRLAKGEFRLVGVTPVWVSINAFESAVMLARTFVSLVQRAAAASRACIHPGRSLVNFRYSQSRMYGDWGSPFVRAGWSGNG